MIKKLASCIRQYKRDSILAPLFIVGEGFMEVVIPLFMARLIDSGIDKGSMPAILRYGLILAVCCMISLSFGVLAARFAAKASAGFAGNLRHDMYYKAQEYSFGNIDKFSTASIVTRMTTDVTNVQNAFQMIIRMAVRAPILLVFALIMSFTVNTQLALIYLCVIPVLALGLYLIVTHAHPLFERVFKTYDKLNIVVQENLHGIRVVKSFVREDHENEKIRKGIRQHL